MVLLTIPVFFPIVTGLGFDPVWFGVLLTMKVALGQAKDGRLHILGEMAKAISEGRKELGLWDRAMNATYLTGELSAADYTLYPYVALMLRLHARVVSSAAL